MNKMFAIREQLIHIQHSGPQAMEDLHSPPTSFSVGDLLPAKGSWPPKHALFAKKHAYYFWKTTDCAPFARIRHKAGSEMDANRTKWTGDRVPGWVAGGMK
jgi:hypothetical protein